MDVLCFALLKDLGKSRGGKAMDNFLKVKLCHMFCFGLNDEYYEAAKRLVSVASHRLQQNLRFQGLAKARLEIQFCTHLAHSFDVIRATQCQTSSLYRPISRTLITYVL